MPAPSDAAPPPTARPGPARGAPDLVDQLAGFLDQADPKIILVKGPPGSGKSTFIRSFAGRLDRPYLVLLYRFLTPAPGATAPAGVSFLMIDPEGRFLPEAAPASPPGGAPAADATAELTEAIGRMARAGRGCLIIDSWDRSTETWARSRGSAVRERPILSGSVPLTPERISELPVPTVMAMVGGLGMREESMADGIIEFTTETWDGPTLRVVAITKMRGEMTLDPRYLYSLEGGEFRCRTHSIPGFVPPTAAPDPDPLPDPSSLWPGSAAFAGAFGRLKTHALTGIEIPESSPGALPEVFSLPLAAHTLRSGGRVLWVPPTSTTPAHLLARLERYAPMDFLRERFRILSASGLDPSVGDLKSILLTVRTEVGEGRDLRPATAQAVAPAFPEGFRFLKATEPGRPALFILHLDGLRALAKVSGAPYDPATFPLLVSTYVRLPGFHGFGIGEAKDPFTAAMLSSLGTYLRVVERHGRILTYGVRPSTPGYMLDWVDGDDRYRLVRVSA